MRNESSTISELIPGSPLLNLSQRVKFRLTYEYELGAEVEAHPDEYGYPASRVPEVAALMVDGMARGTANIRDSRAIRRTCRKLGIKYTIGGITAYLAS